jgi:hypothetical protein
MSNAMLIIHNALDILPSIVIAIGNGMNCLRIKTKIHIRQSSEHFEWCRMCELLVDYTHNIVSFVKEYIRCE